MKLTVKEFTDNDKETYDKFINEPLNHPHATFHHTWEWGEVMKKHSLEFKRLGLYLEDKLVAVGQFSKRKLKVGDFWYNTRGLLLDYSNLELVVASYETVKKFFAQPANKAAFLRVDPDLDQNDPAVKEIDKLHPKKAAIFTQAERIWAVDLQKDEGSLLQWMKDHGARKNVARYIKKAKKEGVKVRASGSKKDLETLISMLNSLNKRKGGIGKHADQHYRDQFSELAESGIEKVFLAEKDGKVLAASLITIFGREASYLHGASSDEMRNLSAPHLLHFETMNYLQKNYPKTERYNFWGIVSDKNRKPNHPRNGYSEFKRSFGGYKQTYMRSRDFVYNPFVWAIDWAIEKYRTIRYKND